jgi:phenylacetate-CoA ligase
MKRGAAFGYPKRPSAQRELEQMKKKPSRHWERAGEEMALSLFKFCVESVPAYKKMLDKKRFDARGVSDIESFKRIPIITKADYLRKYAYTELFPGGVVPAQTTVSATSGSTGEPFFFPREEVHDQWYASALELLLRNQWQAHDRRTLCLIGFGLGIWIGGVFTYKNLNALARKGYPLAVVPVGVHIPMLLKSFRTFAPHFDQIILMSYPPFLKDLLEEGEAEGIDWKKYRLRILTAAEGYSEKFRSYLAEVSGADPVNDMVNIYGTVEQGTIAHETAFGNLIRRLASENKSLFKSLFPNATNIPTLAQYDPRHVYFEEIDGGVVASGYGSSIPLVRYSFADLGGVMSYEKMLKMLSANGVDIAREAKKFGVSGKILKLPFVYVYARSDFAIVLRGANIYPDEIREALDCRVLRASITGRFSAIRRETRSGNQALDIHIELKRGVSAQRKITKKVLETLVAELRSRNSEYNNSYTSDPKSSTPNIILHPFRDPKHFARTGKQSWVRK